MAKNSHFNRLLCNCTCNYNCNWLLFFVFGKNRKKEKIMHIRKQTVASEKQKRKRGKRKNPVWKHQGKKQQQPSVEYKSKEK